MRLVVQLLVLVLVLVVGFCVTLWLPILTLHLRFVLVVTSPKWYVRRTVQLSFDAAKCCFTLEHLPLEDRLHNSEQLTTTIPSIPIHFQTIKAGTYQVYGQQLDLQSRSDLSWNVSWNLRVAICNVFFFEVSNFSFSLTVLPVYGRYMRAVMPRILRNAEGQAVKEAQEARTFRCSVKTCFFACGTCSRYWCCQFKTVPVCKIY